MVPDAFVIPTIHGPNVSVMYTSRMKPITKLKIGKLIRITAGGRHGIYESKIGPVRKPLQV
jgi:hypothetical protein